MRNEQSIRYRINLAIILTLVVVTIVFGSLLMIYEGARRDSAISDIKHSLKELTKQYSDSLGNEIFANQTMALQETLNGLIQQKNILAISAYNDVGVMLASTDKSLFENLSNKQISLLALGPIAELGKLNSHPVLRFKSTITAYAEDVGYWQIYYSTALLKDQTINIIIIFGASILTLSVMLLWLLNRILIRFVFDPIQILSHTMQITQETESKSTAEAKAGRIDKMLASFDKFPQNMTSPATTKNEINSLAYSFQQMLVALKHSYLDIRRDSLTGLANRIKLDEAIEREIIMEQRYLYPFSIILVDIDFFKQVNDNYGHLVGDEVLKTLAELLKNSFRKTDTIGRWGGEEFLILLPKHNREEAVMLAEAFRKQLAASTFPSMISITSSFGVTQYISGEIASDMIKRADDALYQAKALGRNRVEQC